MSTAALGATSPALVVRRAWWAYLPLTLFLAAACAACAAFMWHAELTIVRLALVFPLALLLGALVLVVVRTMRMLDASNWLLRLTREAIVLNPIDVTGWTHGEPVELPLRDILAVRRVVERRRVVGRASIESAHERHVYLEIELADVDVSPLAALRPPIALSSPHTLRIGWRDHETRLTPSLATFFAVLPPTIVRAPDADVRWQESTLLSDDELRERVRALCAGNDEIGAIKVVRVRYKMDLRQAKELVTQLSSPS